MLEIVTYIFSKFFIQVVGNKSSVKKKHYRKIYSSTLKWDFFIFIKVRKTDCSLVLKFSF